MARDGSDTPLPAASPSAVHDGPVHTVLQPPAWPRPRGYSNGMMADGRLVVTGGVVGWNENGVFAATFVGQAEQLLKNIAAILAEAGAGPEHLVRLTWYVTDMD